MHSVHRCSFRYSKFDSDFIGRSCGYSCRSLHAKSYLLLGRHVELIHGGKYDLSAWTCCRLFSPYCSCFSTIETTGLLRHQRRKTIFQSPPSCKLNGFKRTPWRSLNLHIYLHSLLFRKLSFHSFLQDLGRYYCLWDFKRISSLTNHNVIDGATYFARRRLG